MTENEIKNCERMHYFMQLSSYFSELVDLPNVSFAFTNLLSDTWYNQAYNVCNLNLKDYKAFFDSCEEVFKKNDREVCFYITPSASNFSEVLLSSGYALVDEESWMFYDFTKEICDVDSSVRIVSVDREKLDEFGAFYKASLPGPEVDAYVQCVKNGFNAAPPLINIKYYLAYLEEKPVGMLSYLSFGEYAGVYAVAVLEDYQNMGVCKALVNRIVNVARESNIKFMFLQTGNGEDSEMIFEKLNFRQQFVRRGYVKETTISDITHG